MNPLTPDPSFPAHNAVWPPPPTIDAPPVQPAAFCPFQWLYRRAPGKIGANAKVSDLREGVLVFDTQGLIIQGKAAPRAEIRVLILIPCFLISVLIAAVASYVMDNLFRQETYLGVRWSDVREVVLAPAKQQACVIYEAPNYAGKKMTFSLAFTPAPGYYDLFAQMAGQYASVPVTEDRLRNATPPLLWGILILLLLFIIGLIVWAALPTHSGR